MHSIQHLVSLVPPPPLPVPPDRCRNPVTRNSGTHPGSWIRTPPSGDDTEMRSLYGIERCVCVARPATHLSASQLRRTQKWSRSSESDASQCPFVAPRSTQTRPQSQADDVSCASESQSLRAGAIRPQGRDAHPGRCAYMAFWRLCLDFHSAYRHTVILTIHDRTNATSSLTAAASRIATGIVVITGPASRFHRASGLGPQINVEQYLSNWFKSPSDGGPWPVDRSRPLPPLPSLQLSAPTRPGCRVSATPLFGMPRAGEMDDLA